MTCTVSLSHPLSRHIRSAISVGQRKNYRRINAQERTLNVACFDDHFNFQVKTFGSMNERPDLVAVKAAYATYSLLWCCLQQRRN